MSLQSLFKFLIQALKMGILLGISILFFYLPKAKAENKPQWFPKVSCVDAWQGQDPYQYSHEQFYEAKSDNPGNFGYQNFINASEAKTSVTRQDCYKKWTMLVYMAADNDLSPYSFWDLIEMEADYPVEREIGYLRAGSTITNDLIVDLQNEKSRDLKRLHIFQSEKRFDRDFTLKQAEQVDLNDIHSPIAYWRDQRTGSPEEQLYDFVQWGIKQYPAENYMVVVWGHGQGWGSGQIDTTQDSVFAGRFGGLAFQDHNDEYLTTPALSRVLEKTQTEVFDNYKSVDVYASDACLMQMTEVAYELAPYTKYIVGSAQIQSYLGFPYRRMMYEINRGCYNQREEGNTYCDDNIGLSTTRPDSYPVRFLQRVCGDDHACYLSQMLPRLSHQSFHNQLGLQGRASPESYNDMTMSSFNARSLLQKVPNLMNQLAKALLSYMETTSDESRIELQKLITDSHKFLGEGREVGILLGHIENYMREQNSQEALKVIEVIIDYKSELNTLVLSHAYGRNYVEQGFGLLGARSVALWIPSTENIFEFRREDFRASQLYKNLEKLQNEDKSHWELFLETLLKPRKKMDL